MDNIFKAAKHIVIIFLIELNKTRKLKLLFIIHEIYNE